MSRILIPYAVSDISVLARSLRDQLESCGHTPGHVEMLNMLAHSAGHRNFQSFRAQTAAQHRLEQAVPAAPPIDHQRLERIIRHFDSDQRLATWPAKSSMQELCLWVLWSKLPVRHIFTEMELNAWIRAQHCFGDHALLRRELCDHGLLIRTADGRDYRRVEQRPPAEAAALIHLLSARRPQ